MVPQMATLEIAPPCGQKPVASMFSIPFQLEISKKYLGGKVIPVLDHQVALGAGD